ncbi:hypothetical protein JCM10213v2_001899 [Rhodosporidiobolus nylandii]
MAHLLRDGHAALPCAPGQCQCNNCHGGVDKNKEAGCCKKDAAGNETCDCSSSQDCKCEAGKCACASCGNKRKAAA